MSSDNLFSSFELKEGKTYFGKSFFLSDVLLTLKSIADIHFSIDVYKRPTVESGFLGNLNDNDCYFDLEIIEESNQNFDDHGRLFKKNKIYCYSNHRVFYIANKYACILVQEDFLNKTNNKITNHILSK